MTEPRITHVVNAKTQRVIGMIVRGEQGSYFVQRKVVQPDHCVNHGLNWQHMLRDGVNARPF